MERSGTLKLLIQPPESGWLESLKEKQMIRMLVLVSVFFLTSCVSYNVRLDDLEKRQDYIFEVMRGRRLSEDRCVAYTNPKMSCSINEKGSCACVFPADDQDRENLAFQKAIQKAKDDAAKTSKPAKKDEE
jgi:hypothetical protein